MLGGKNPSASVRAILCKYQRDTGQGETVEVDAQ